MSVVKLNSSPSASTPGAKSGDSTMLYLLGFIGLCVAGYHFVVKPMIKKAEEDKKKATKE